MIPVEVGLVTVFYWAIYRPDLFPVSQHLPWVYGKIFWWVSHRSACVDPVACELGDCLPADLFQGKAFGVIWWSFSLVAVIAAVLSWAVVCVKHDLYQPGCRVVPNVADDWRVPIYGLVPGPRSARDSASHRY